MKRGLWTYTLVQPRYLPVLTETCPQAQSLSGQTQAVNLTTGLPYSCPNSQLPFLCWAGQGDHGVPEAKATSSTVRGAGDPNSQPALNRSGANPDFAVR